VNAAFFPPGTSDAVGHSTPEQLLENALSAQRWGSLGDATRLYASVLRIDPTNAAAHGNLAIRVAYPRMWQSWLSRQTPAASSIESA
jgi:hypothetical protein